jgi:hypothetical protein
MLLIPQVPVGKSKKLAKLWKGPYRIDSIDFNLNVSIIHFLNVKDKQTVHIARLKPYFGQLSIENKEQKPEDHYEIEAILESRFNEKGNKEYLIKWKGWSHKYNQWRKEEDIQAPELLQAWSRREKKKPQIQEVDIPDLDQIAAIPSLQVMKRRAKKPARPLN